MQLNPSKPAFNYKIQTGLFYMKHKEDIRTKWDVIMGSTLTKSKACTNFYTVIAVFLAVKSCLTLCDPVDCSPPGSSVHGILQQEYWNGLPFPPAGHLPHPEMEPLSCFRRCVLHHWATWEVYDLLICCIDFEIRKKNCTFLIKLGSNFATLLKIFMCWL